MNSQISTIHTLHLSLRFDYFFNEIRELNLVMMVTHDFFDF